MTVHEEIKILDKLCGGLCALLADQIFRRACIFQRNFDTHIFIITYLFGQKALS